ncbi:phosphatase PAP2 family protein [Pseudaminobacter sp. 19-2017]|uniref:Phosphatase PAP2 family protein n=1 Tax=Pseudaminobacter soli (ex Zhang et al. 2022) TaxID=2831468 RepID=A0A942DXJ5_9HYPH|nr:phosphatase PAP2 family protein [Pseudaminobacter soli]MBS3649664.1 phosphatase PAP2 family protein [Pseudaminobacter soli]
MEPRAASSEDPIFPGRALWLVAIFGLAAINATWLILSPISIDPQTLVQPLVFGYVGLLLSYIAWRLKLPRALLEVPSGLAFILLAWLNLRVLNHLTMSLSFPLVDEVLASWDEALGFRWLGYLEWAAARPSFIKVLSMVYVSLTSLSVLVFLGLYAAGRGNRAQEFILIFFATALATIIIGAGFPAKAAISFHSPQQELLSALPTGSGVYHLVYLEGLRNDTGHVLTGPLPGLVTFPSLHTAAALVMAYACRGMIIAFPLAALYALLMFAATPLLGGHYFVDLIGGTVLVAVVVATHCIWRSKIAHPVLAVRA